MRPGSASMLRPDLEIGVSPIREPVGRGGAAAPMNATNSSNATAASSAAGCPAHGCPIHMAIGFGVGIPVAFFALIVAWIVYQRRLREEEKAASMPPPPHIPTKQSALAKLHKGGVHTESVEPVEVPKLAVQLQELYQDIAAQQAVDGLSSTALPQAEQILRTMDVKDAIDAHWADGELERVDRPVGMSHAC